MGPRSGAADLARAALVQAALTWFLTGLIWTVQIVHYPLFASVGPDAFPAYASRHAVRITWVVGAPMLLELLLAIWLAWRWPGPAWHGPRRTATIGLLLVMAIWLSTALLQVPAHEQLASGFDEAAHRRLVGTNWIRTSLWTVRALFVAPVLLTASRRLSVSRDA